MKRKNKSGFTLIELLAVIVILAIIALIAVPVVMNIITKSRKSAFKDSAYGIIKAGELYYADRLLEPEGMTEDKTFTFPSDTTGLDIKGSKPSSGSVIVTKEGKVAIGVTDGKYCVTKGFENADVTITEDIENCKFPKIIYTNGIMSSENKCITKGNTCILNTDGIMVTVQVNENQTEDFYVLADDGNKATLILNRNLGDNVAWCASAEDNSCGPITVVTYLQSQTSTWTNLPEMIISEFEYTNNTPKTLSQSFTMYARLPKYSELYAINNSHYLANTPWLYTNLYTTGDDSTEGYWTSTANYFTDGAHYVDYNGAVYSSSVNDDSSIGVRQVIELSK